MILVVYLFVWLIHPSGAVPAFILLLFLFLVANLGNKIIASKKKNDYFSKNCNLKPL